MKLRRKTRRIIFFSAIGTVIVLTIMCLWSLRVHSQPDLEWTSYRVRQGDTIWGIAEQYCPDGMDIDEWIWQVREHNRADALIQPGQELRILVEGEAL